MSRALLASLQSVTLALVAGMTMCVPAFAQQPPQPQKVTIGYVELAGDPRYEPI